jgi:ABC-2 type transport system permease protein
VRKYITVFNLGLQNTFVYRWNYFLRAVFGLIPLAGTVFLWRAVFREPGGGMNGYDYGSMIYYYLLTIIVSNLVTPTEDEWQIASDIREGQINSFLTKPVNYLAYRFSIFLSGRLVFTAVTVLPVAVILFYFRAYLALPSSVLTYICALLSLVMAALMQFFITYSLAMMAFWILEISTIVFIVYSFEYFLGGQMFPVDIMPAGIQAVMKWLPFYYELFCPIAIFMERLRQFCAAESLQKNRDWTKQLVIKRQPFHHRLDSGGHDVDGKHLAAEKIFKRVNDEDDGRDFQDPEGHHGEAVGDEKLHERRHHHRQAAVDIGQCMIRQRNVAPEINKNEGDGRQGDYGVNETAAQKDAESIREITHRLGQERIDLTFANIGCDLPFVFGGRDEVADQEREQIIINHRTVVIAVHPAAALAKDRAPEKHRAGERN